MKIFLYMLSNSNLLGLGQMPVLSCPNFSGDLYHSRGNYLNTNKYLGRSNYLSNYLHLQIQSPSGIARGQLLPGAGRRGGGQSCQRFFKNLYKEKFKKF